MALFSRNKKETKSAASSAVAAKPQARKALSTDANLASVIIKPRITEKAVAKSEQNVYTFLVRPDATKYDVRAAITSIYNVTPVKVNIVKQAPRTYLSRAKGRHLTAKGTKKAYVFLKAGDTITLV